MSFQDKLSRIEQLQAAISNYGKIPVEVLNKINYKFRLDWNYYSNSMEGNSLTQAETRSVMVGNITVEGKPLQDIMEMKNHDETINNIIRMGKGELNISEKRIKELHSAIMYEEDPEKGKKIGQWKTERNYLHNYKGERFDFAEPGEVPEKMHALVNWVNAEKEKIDRKDKKALHPVLLAFRFHLDYVSIHPFYDGNGRTSRILCNIILISYGYPPIYVKTAERETYYRYLADIQAYGGDSDLLYDFMAGLLIRSQEIFVDAIEGRDISEADDLDKRLRLLENRLSLIQTDNEIRIELDEDVFLNIYKDWLGKFMLKSIDISSKFNRLFSGTRHLISVNDASIHFDDEPNEVIMDWLIDEIKETETLEFAREIKVQFQTDYGVFKKEGLDGFNCKCGWEINFNKFSYELVMVNDFENSDDYNMKSLILIRRLDQPLLDKEMEDLTQKLGNTILDRIEANAKNIGLT